MWRGGGWDPVGRGRGVSARMGRRGWTRGSSAGRQTDLRVFSGSRDGTGPMWHPTPGSDHQGSLDEMAGSISCARTCPKKDKDTSEARGNRLENVPVVRSITVNDSGTDYNPNETESGVCVHEPTNGRGGRGPSRWHWTPPCGPWSQPTQARNRNHANQCGRGEGRPPESVSRGGASLRRGLAGSASIAAPTGHGPCHRQVPPGEGAQEGHSTARALRGGRGGRSRPAVMRKRHTETT